MINALEVFTASRNLGSTRSYTECKVFIDAFDWEGERESERGRYKATLWTRGENVNGIAASVIAEDVTDEGEVLFVYIDEKLVVIQKHDPTQSGFVAMNEELALQVGNEMIAQFIESVVDEKARETVIVQMIS